MNPHAWLVLWKSLELASIGGDKSQGAQCPLPSKVRQKTLDLNIIEFHKASKGTYVSPRIASDLAEASIPVCENTVQLA